MMGIYKHTDNYYLYFSGEVHTFLSVDSDSNLSHILDNQTPVLSKIDLKVGAQVMLMKNLDVARGLVNGARGVVISFKSSQNG